jgi:hypothetical protein
LTSSDNGKGNDCQAKGNATRAKQPARGNITPYDGGDGTALNILECVKKLIVGLSVDERLLHVWLAMEHASLYLVDPCPNPQSNQGENQRQNKHYEGEKD